MSLVRPLAPFETWPVQFHDAKLGAFVWYARPAVFVTQPQQPVATLAHGELVGRLMDHVLVRFQHEIELHQGLLVIHDWRKLDSYDMGVRDYYTKRIESYKKGTQRGAVIATNKGPLLRSVLQLAAMALPSRTGHALQLVSDPSPLLAQHNIEPVAMNPFLG